MVVPVAPLSSVVVAEAVWEVKVTSTRFSPATAMALLGAAGPWVSVLKERVVPAVQLPPLVSLV